MNFPKMNISPRRESNPRPSAYHADALPLSYWGARYIFNATLFNYCLPNLFVVDGQLTERRKLPPYRGRESLRLDSEQKRHPDDA